MFLKGLDGAIEQIARNPERYASDEFGTRRMRLRRFPFLVIYRKAGAGAEVIAIAHGRRRPKFLAGTSRLFVEASNRRSINSER